MSLISSSVVNLRCQKNSSATLELKLQLSLWWDGRDRSSVSEARPWKFLQLVWQIISVHFHPFPTWSLRLSIMFIHVPGFVVTKAAIFRSQSGRLNPSNLLYLGPNWTVGLWIFQSVEQLRHCSVVMVVSSEPASLINRFIHLWKPFLVSPVFKPPPISPSPVNYHKIWLLLMNSDCYCAVSTALVFDLNGNPEFIIIYS